MNWKSTIKKEKRWQKSWKRSNKKGKLCYKREKVKRALSRFMKRCRLRIIILHI